MNRKNIVLTLAILLCSGARVLADAVVKDLDGTNVEITFTYRDDKAAAMNVIGSFNAWTVPGDAMTRNAEGTWELTIKATVADEIQYKFYDDGTWIFDEKAPDRKDDGFGGNNGLIVVADMLAGKASSSPAAGTVAAPGARKPAATRPKVAFGTLTYLESDTTFATAGSAFDPLDSSVRARSIWKFQGDLVPGMPGHIELTFFDGMNSVYHEAGIDPFQPLDPPREGLKLADGLESLASGFIFNPAYYLGGNERPRLGKFGFGFDSPFIAYDSGYADAWLPRHESILWDTVENEGIKADKGYSAFSLGSRLQQIGALWLDAAFVPNRSLNGYYGFYAFASAASGDWKGELQYEMRSSTGTEPLEIFVDVPRQDIVSGFSGSMGMLGIKAQALYSMFVSGGAADSRPVQDKIAAELALGYSDSFDTWSANAGYKYRGFAAQMLYADNDAELGLADTMTASADGSLRIGRYVTAKIAASALLQNVDTTGSNIAISLKPGTTLDFSVPGRVLTADIYARIGLDTLPEAGADMITFPKAGAKLSLGDLSGVLEGIDLYYGFDNAASDVMFNSLLAELALAHDLKAQLGFGLRSGKSATAVNPLGASMGASWKLPVPQAKEPVLYAQFVYNMDPYDADGRNAFAFDADNPWIPSGGSSKSDGSSAVRLGIKWDF